MHPLAAHPVRFGNRARRLVPTLEPCSKAFDYTKKMALMAHEHAGKIVYLTKVDGNITCALFLFCCWA